MKYSISILFLLTILAAVEAALFRRLEWSILVTVSLCMMLLWTVWPTRLTTFTRNFSKDAINLSIGLCVAGAIVSILSGATNSEGKLLNDNPRMVSANAVLILAAILLSSSLVHIPKRCFKPIRIVASAVIVFGLILCLGYEVDPLLWLVYIACRGIENSSRDPHWILGQPRVLLYSSAVIKAVVGVLGWSAWILVAVFTYRRVQRRSSGMFNEVWIAGGLGCLATYHPWHCLLEDFPELHESLNVLRYETYNYNVVLFVFLGVTGLFQYSMIDLAVEEPAKQPMMCSEQVWRNRLLGIIMMVPMLMILGSRALNLNALGIGWFGWIIMASELVGNESLMLLSLLLLGIRVIANAKNGPAKFVPLAPVSLFQLLVIGCVLIVLVPTHFAASQFYFEAVLMLFPGF